MKLGTVIPQPELGADPEDLLTFVQSAEDLGYDYVVLYEIMLKTPDIIKGDLTHPECPNNWHAPFVLMSYLAARTKRIRFATGVSVLPTRPTIQVAKQAASLDRLSNGRLQLGVSVGWNKGEYRASGMSTRDRGRRMSEQVKVLRELWGNDIVSFHGRYHQLEDVSLGIRPVQDPIPVWIGGYAEPVFKRAAYLGDGWCGNIVPYERATDIVTKLRHYSDEAGRKRELGVSFCATLHNPDEWRQGIPVPVDWEKYINDYTELGATHLEVSTTSFGALKTVEEHIDAITRFKDHF
jgi:probable F420-dependent oxidoreductase